MANSVTRALPILPPWPPSLPSLSSSSPSYWQSPAATWPSLPPSRTSSLLPLPSLSSFSPIPPTPLFLSHLSPGPQLPLGMRFPISLRILCLLIFWVFSKQARTTHRISCDASPRFRQNSECNGCYRKNQCLFYQNWPQDSQGPPVIANFDFYWPWTIYSSS